MIDLFRTSYLQLEAYLRAGGVVMVPLALVSVVMWVLIADRALFFRRLHRKNMEARTAWDHIRADRMPDPRRFRGAVSVLVAQFLSRRSGDPDLDRFILDEAVHKVSRSLNDYLALIGVLAAVAPFLGLLGTVTGMIATFDVLAVFGTGNAKAMAGGISEALVTTQTGLLVAIPGLYMKGFLDRRSRNLQQRIAAVGYYLKRQI
jgi:biopolymer transport protein ExbB